MNTEVAVRRAAFRALHQEGCFVIPNPWDIGSARLLEKLGFKALASTSAGYAWTRGRNDGELTRDEVLSHLRDLCNATALPVNADFEAGFADEPEEVAANVLLAVETGVAGSRSRIELTRNSTRCPSRSNASGLHAGRSTHPVRT